MTPAEALAEAVEVEFGSTPTRVLSAEHLAAIMLETGRPQDHARLIPVAPDEPLDVLPLRTLIEVQGPPVSQTIIEERR